MHAIRFHGNAAISSATLAARISLKPGQPYTPEKLMFSRGLVQAQFQDAGYWTVVVSTAIETPAPHQVDIVFHIMEGPLYRIGTITISGNKLLSEPVIRHELGIHTGDPFSEAKVYEGHRQLYLTGYFHSIDVIYSSGATHVVDIGIKVVENPTRFIKGSAGYGAEEKELVSLGYEDRNFFGSGRKFNAQAVESGFATDPAKYQTTLAEVGLTDPYFLGSSFQAQTDIAQEWRRRESYDAQTTAWHSQLGRRLGKDLLLDLHYRFEATRFITDDPSLIELAGYTRISAAGPDFTYDNTGDPFLPYTGWRIKGSYEEGFTFPIGDLQFYKWEGKVGRFETFFDQWTLFMGTQAGLIKPQDPNVQIPIFERFFLGGANTVRGYGERELGPRDVLGDPLGGDAYAVGNVEIRHRLYKQLFGVVFLDGGQLWTRSQGDEWPDINAHGIGDFRYGSGGGLRFHTPIGAIRLEVGYELNPEFGETRFLDRTAVHFSLGEVF